jgi:hypothetical protein
MIIKVLSGQTLIDIALQQYGCYEGIAILCQDNGLSFTSEIKAGDTLIIRDAMPELTDTNIKIAAYYAANKVQVNNTWFAPTGDFLSDDFLTTDFKTL